MTASTTYRLTKATRTALMAARTSGDHGMLHLWRGGHQASGQFSSTILGALIVRGLAEPIIGDIEVRNRHLTVVKTHTGAVVGATLTPAGVEARRELRAAKGMRP